MSHPHTEPGRHHQGTANNKALLLSVDTLFSHRILSIYTVHKYGTFGEVFCILRFFGLEKEPRRSSQYHVSCRPLRNCCVPTILITTWVRASGSSWPRTPPSHSEWPPRSEDVSSIFFSAAACVQVPSLVRVVTPNQNFSKASLLATGDRAESHEDKADHELLALR